MHFNRKVRSDLIHPYEWAAHNLPLVRLIPWPRRRLTAKGIRPTLGFCKPLAPAPTAIEFRLAVILVPGLARRWFTLLPSRPAAFRCVKLLIITEMINDVHISTLIGSAL